MKAKTHWYTQKERRRKIQRKLINAPHLTEEYIINSTVAAKDPLTRWSKNRNSPKTPNNYMGSFLSFLDDTKLSTHATNTSASILSPYRISISSPTAKLSFRSPYLCRSQTSSPAAKKLRYVISPNLGRRQIFSLGGKKSKFPGSPYRSCTISTSPVAKSQFIDSSHSASRKSKTAHLPFHCSRRTLSPVAKTSKSPGSPYVGRLTSKSSGVNKLSKVSFQRNLFNVTATKDLDDDEGGEVQHQIVPLDTGDDPVQELIALVPHVMKELSKSDGLPQTILAFFRQVKDNRFPLDNISFQLWCEVVRWYENKSTTSMRYTRGTKTFWKLGWRMFGGRFVHFMSGYKSHGDILTKTSDPGHYTPESSEINFAVPDKHILRSFDPYSVTGAREPGIYTDIMAKMNETLYLKSSCLTYDGKKLKQGLDKDSGDVDLLGFEDGKTLLERKTHLMESLSEVENIKKSLADNNENSQNDLKILLLSRLKLISQNILEIREIKKKKEYCRMKLIERGGNDDWRKGKYVYAISAVIAFLHDIDGYLMKATSITEDICRYLAFTNGASFVEEKTLNLNTCQVYKSVEDITSELCLTTSDNTRLIKQRSEEWFDLRKTAKVTGSKLYTAVGGDGIGKEKNYFENTVCGVKETEPSEATRLAMEHGSRNEVNAVATIAGKVIPVLYPGMIVCEEGCVLIENGGKTFMVVSPDGSIRSDLCFESTKVAIEIKCPVQYAYSKFPPRYLLQCLSEIEVLDVETLLFISWTDQETMVFRVQRDTKLFDHAVSIAFDIYSGDRPKKPTKLTESQRELRRKIIDKSTKVELVGRFSSLTSSDVIDEKTTMRNPDIIQLLDSINAVCSQCYELTRERASEAMVFLIADLNRSWKKDTIRSAPISWFPKGYSLPTDQLRKIVEHVHTECHQRGVHIPCESFDGQWHVLVTRSVDRQPLTKLQLQKDVWREVEQMKKIDIIAEFKKMNKSVCTDVTLINGTVKNIALSNSASTRLPVLLPSVNKSTNTNEQEREEVLEANITTTLADVLPDSIKVSHDLNDDVLAMTAPDAIELDIFSANVGESVWEDELSNDQSVESGVEERQMGDETRHELLSPSPAASLSAKVTLETEDMRCILNLLKTNKVCNKKGKWDETQTTELLLYFTSVEKLQSLLDTELREVARYLKRTKGLAIKESGRKQTKVQAIGELLNLKPAKVPECQCINKKMLRRKHIVRSLADLACGVLSKVRKHDLNIAYASYLWPDRLDEWYTSLSSVTVNGKEMDWFYKPELSLKRKQFEVKCIDATHLLTRARRTSCKGRIDGVSKESWMKVAKSRKTLLTPIMVEEVTDPMSVTMAATHFSESVENCMISNGDKDAAEFCRDVRMWWMAEDSPGLAAHVRINLRHNLRKRLLNHADFGKFPPPTMFISGWPQQLWEAILANIDAKTWLYGFCHNGTYNVRAFSSMVGETFFSELTMNDRRGQGTVSAKEFGEYIGHAIEQTHIRMDPSRTFSYSTKPTTVYQLVDDSVDDADGDYVSEDRHGTQCRICDGQQHVLPTNIITKDHAFDLDVRRRLPGRRKHGTVSTDRNSLQKGSLGVRWEKARCNESKMLPDKKLGL